MRVRNDSMARGKPNILYIMADQMAAPLLSMYRDDSEIKTPNLQRLASEGVVFESAYCNAPLCAPSRFCMVTGQLPHRIGAYDNGSNLAADIPTYAHYLRAMGYHTALSGKMHFCGPDQLHGYEQRLTSDIYPGDFGWTVDWDNPEIKPDWSHNMSSVLDAGPCVRSNQLDFDEEVTYKATQYLYDHVRHRSNQPFCLTVSLTHPHDPYAISREFWDLYENEPISLPSHTIPQSEQDPHSKRILQAIDLWGRDIPEHCIRNARRAYYGSCSYVDTQVGKLLKTLADCGLASNTIIVFSGDHGDMLGERGLWYKMNWFEMSARVPLLVHYPSRFAPRRVPNAVSTLDMLPTLVHLAGGDVDPALPLDGRSLLPHLLDRPATGPAAPHDEVLGEYMAEGTCTPVVMIRRGDYKFIFSLTDPPQLYHLPSDPHELVNLAAPSKSSTTSPHAPLLDDFTAEVHRRWDLRAIHADVLASQRRRRLVARALATGHVHSWEYQPFVDASTQYVRNRQAGLDEVEWASRYPRIPKVEANGDGNVPVVGYVTGGAKLGGV